MNSHDLGSNRNSKGQFLPGTHWRKHAIFREADYLYTEYVIKQRTVGDIAREHGVGGSAIDYWMRRHNIPRRSFVEARALSAAQGRRPDLSGKNNPMYGRVGPLNPRYVDGSSPERQRLYASSQWKALIRFIYARDEYTCQRCGQPRTRKRTLVAHHIQPWAGNRELRMVPENLITLCQNCHRWVHSKKNVEHEFLV